MGLALSSFSPNDTSRRNQVTQLRIRSDKDIDVCWNVGEDFRNPKSRRRRDYPAREGRRDDASRWTTSPKLWQLARVACARRAFSESSSITSLASWQRASWRAILRSVQVICAGSPFVLASPMTELRGAMLPSGVRTTRRAKVFVSADDHPLSAPRSAPSRVVTGPHLKHFRTELIGYSCHTRCKGFVPNMFRLSMRHCRASARDKRLSRAQNPPLQMSTSRQQGQLSSSSEEWFENSDLICSLDWEAKAILPSHHMVVKSLPSWRCRERQPMITTARIASGSFLRSVHVERPDAPPCEVDESLGIRSLASPSRSQTSHAQLLGAREASTTLRRTFNR